jgi:hypothetical protein
LRKSETARTEIKTMTTKLLPIFSLPAFDFTFLDQASIYGYVVEQSVLQTQIPGYQGLPQIGGIEGRRSRAFKLIITTYKKQNNKIKSTYAIPLRPWKTLQPENLSRLCVQGIRLFVYMLSSYALSPTELSRFFIGDLLHYKLLFLFVNLNQARGANLKRKSGVFADFCWNIDPNSCIFFAFAYGFPADYCSNSSASQTNTECQIMCKRYVTIFDYYVDTLTFYSETM